MKTALFLSSLILAGTMTTQASAASVTRNVSAGKTSLIFSFYVYDPDQCASSAYPKPSLSNPKNGKLTSKRTPFRIPKGKKCAGTKVNAVSVYYTPKAGFRGKDTARFGYRYFQYTGEDKTSYYNVRARINVK